MKKAPPKQCFKCLVGTSELESPTPTMSRWCSNQLSYAPIIVTITTKLNAHYNDFLSVVQLSIPLPIRMSDF